MKKSHDQKHKIGLKMNQKAKICVFRKKFAEEGKEIYFLPAERPEAVLWKRLKRGTKGTVERNRNWKIGTSKKNKNNKVRLPLHLRMMKMVQLKFNTIHTSHCGKQ